jgi:hypothetical protein
VLYAGQIAGGRGVRLLLRAVAKLRRRRPVRLILAGAVEEGFQQVLDEACFEAGLTAEDVERLGAIDHDDMPRVIARATVCVAPSAPDAAERPLASFPSKLLEYMACRRPVVAPRRPPATEIVSDSENGLLFNNGDAADLARCIGRILDDGELRERLSAAGYERVRRDHPASATRRSILEAYTRLFPSSAWTPPSAGVAPINALPTHPDTTTARRPMPQPLVDGRAEGERSGEIIIDNVTPSQPGPFPASPTTVMPTEVVIEMEALTEEEMQQEWFAEGFAEGAVTQKIIVAAALPIMADADTQAINLQAPAPGFASDDTDDKTSPGPLRPRNRSG